MVVGISIDAKNRRAGSGVATSSDAAIASSDRPVRSSLIGRDDSRDVWLLTLGELRASPPVRAFLDHFAEQAT
jgi:hypothetical protein